MISPPNRLHPFAYHELMPFQVKDILVVASAYDSFILEEEGQFSDRLLQHYLELDLAVTPHFEHVVSSRAAFQQLRRRHYDLVVTTPHIADSTPERLGAEIASRYPELPVVLLTYDRADAHSQAGGPRAPGIERVFVWTGDPKLLLALVKSVEDRTNADHDTRRGLVRVIILVEDSPAFTSSYLPIIYSELLEQVRSLLADRLNERERHYRMRARPKILLARTFEEGRELFKRYQRYLLGVICDVHFPREGRLDDQAGIDFIRGVRKKLPDLPILLQSREPAHDQLARDLGVQFADKNSPELLGELREFMRGNLGFGPFVFRTPEGEEVARAGGIRKLVEVLPTVPAASLRYHAERNHFSNWLMARSEFGLALEVAPQEGLRLRLRRGAAEVPHRRLHRVHRAPPARAGHRLRSPGRAAAPQFHPHRQRLDGRQGARHRLRRPPARRSPASTSATPGCAIGVPRTTVISTDVFERFCETGQSPRARGGGRVRRRGGAAVPRRAARRRADGGPQDPAVGGPLSAGGALVEPARGLRVPPPGRALQDRPAAQLVGVGGHPPGAALARHPPDLGIDLLHRPAHLHGGHLAADGGGADGGDRRAAGGPAATATASTPTSPASPSPATSTRWARSPPRTASPPSPWASARRW